MDTKTSGVLLAALLWASTSGATGIECFNGEGRIVGTAAPIVFVEGEDGRVAVSDDPELIGTAPETLPTDVPVVVSPDDVCATGWVLPAPHPGDPLPGPAPVLGAPKPRPSAAGGARPLAGTISLGTAAVTEDGTAPTGASTEASSSGGSAPIAKEDEGDDLAFVVATEEPTPTPAMPPARQANSASTGSCQSVGAAGGHGLFGLLLLGLAAAGRKRRGGR
jgi:MYXO-CTERM domain-containing protein